MNEIERILWRIVEKKDEDNVDSTQVGYQDDCLIAITDGKPLPAESLRSLPPWRAVLIARVANKAGISISDGTTLNALVEEARNAPPDAMTLRK